MHAQPGNHANLISTYFEITSSHGDSNFGSDAARTNYFAWNELPADLFNKLFNAQPKIMSKIIEAKGKQTKY